MTDTDPPTPDRTSSGAAPPRGSGHSPAPRRHRRARRAVAVAGLAAVAVIVLVATRGGSAGPDDVVEDYATAIRDGDCDALVASVSATKWEHGPLTRDEALAACRDEIAGYDGWGTLRVLRTNVVEPRVAPDVRVEADVVLDGDRFTADFTLVDEDGWKVMSCPAFPSLPCA